MKKKKSTECNERRRPNYRRKLYSLQLTLWCSVCLMGGGWVVGVSNRVAIASGTPATRGLHCAAVAQAETQSVRQLRCGLGVGPRWMQSAKREMQTTHLKQRARDRRQETGGRRQEQLPEFPIMLSYIKCKLSCSACPNEKWGRIANIVETNRATCINWLMRI